MDTDYWDGLQKQIDLVYLKIGQAYDPRPKYPWLIGALGDPNSKIWFIAENPSLIQIEKMDDPSGCDMTPEAQWWSSRGDRLFRECLLETGFKSGTISSPGGWNCYITNVIKQPDYVSKWNAKSWNERYKLAQIWSSVLAWEMNSTQPKYIVILGEKAEKYLLHLHQDGLIELPAYHKIYHYSYIGQRAAGMLGPMHPNRVLAYHDDFHKIRTSFTHIIDKSR